MVINYTMKVIGNNNSVAVRSGPGSEYQVVTMLTPGDSVSATQKNNSWYFVNGVGWSHESYLSLQKDNDGVKTKSVTGDQLKEKMTSGQLSDNDLADVYVSYVNSSPDELDDTFLTQNMNNILGIPYQFPAHVDRKTSNNGVFGRKYAERIIANMPLLLLTPGESKFMSDVNSSVKSKFADTLYKLGIDKDLTFGDSDLQSYINKPTKYYTFSFNSDYYMYVNSILNSTAVLLGIGDVYVDICGHKDNLRSFSWQNAANPLTANLGNSDINYICMYVDAVTSKNESFSNDTMESQLVSKINSFSETAKEVQFLLGESASNAISNLSEDIQSQAQSTIDSIVDSTLSGNQIFKDLTKQFSTVAQGGKLLFPQIYQDSSFSQSHDFSMKLRCPNPTLLNWYMDIMVPLGFIYAFVMPRAADNNIGYKSPFLIRGFYKSECNIDLGLMTDLSVSKGKEGSWTPDGLPTEVDVEFTIKDLYNVLYMSKSSSLKECGSFVSNDQFMSFLANQVGININKTDMERTLEMYAMLSGNAFVQRPGYWSNKVKETVNNKLLSLYNGAFKI